MKYNKLFRKQTSLEKTNTDKLIKHYSIVYKLTQTKGHFQKINQINY